MSLGIYIYKECLHKKRHIESDLKAWWMHHGYNSKHKVIHQKDEEPIKFDRCDPESLHEIMGAKRKVTEVLQKQPCKHDFRY